jgi:hypothetical protein
LPGFTAAVFENYSRKFSRKGVMRLFKAAPSVQQTQDVENRAGSFPMTKKFCTIAAAFALLAVPGTSKAAPFCVVTSSGTNCWYYDAESCRQAAGQRGACVVNSNESSPAQPNFINSSAGARDAQELRIMREREIGLMLENEQRARDMAAVQT